MIVQDGRILRFAQDDLPTYGRSVRVFEVDTLTPSAFHQHELDSSPVVRASGTGWNALGMHTFDPHFDQASWIACVDGLAPQTTIVWRAGARRMLNDARRWVGIE